MIVEGRRLWVDSHVHVRGWQEREPLTDVEMEMLVAVMDGDAMRPVWVISFSWEHPRVMQRDVRRGIPLANEGLYRFLGHVPRGRLFGSVGVHPDALDESMAAIDRYGGERGFVQVGEVLGRNFGFSLDCPGMVQIARKASEVGLPVQVCASTSDGPECHQMQQAISLARRVPDAKIIAAGGIGGPDSQGNIAATASYLEMGGDNLWLEISDVSNRDWLHEAVERLGSDRLICGTGWIGVLSYPEDLPPYAILNHRNVKTMREDVSAPREESALESLLREFGCDDDDVANIAARNALELFELEGRVQTSGESVAAGCK